MSVHLIFKDTFNIFVSEKFTKMLTTRNTLIDMFYTIILHVHCISIVTSWYLETLFVPPEWPVFCCPWSVDTWWCVPATWVGRLTGEGGSPALKEGQSAECMYVAVYQYWSVIQYKYAYQNHNISMKINIKISMCIRISTCVNTNTYVSTCIGTFFNTCVFSRTALLNSVHLYNCWT